MKIAIVVPYVHKIEGNRLAFSLARALSRLNSVTLFIHTITQRTKESVEDYIRPAELKYIKIIDQGHFGVRFSLNYQFLRKKAKELAKFITDNGEYDIVFVIANEGHWLPQYIKKNSRAKVLLLVMELHDHGVVSMERYPEKNSMLRNIVFSPFYGFLKFFERSRFEEFDGFFANSTWTKTLFEYLYGLYVQDVLYVIDTDLFKPGEPYTADKYIAVPTVSLSSDINGREMVKRLAKDGIPLVAYGPLNLEGVKNLGYLDENTMVKVLSGASATLFLYNYEALGLIPFESLACGTPVITYNKQGPSLELAGNENVTFISTYEELLDACRKALEREKDNEIKESCRTSVIRFSPENVGERLEKDLQKFL
ncbi:hypothetical protein [Thermoplasma volcanium GSS1]|uniref:Glycosyl transferase family 1 domain-containing protein n=1 Tax=Thermoplasma volcanium (strain ATCC 51530 / DSM 4299 / JCM 9571 / NBRC 15438 / GSS1) TaxID=273116 RepID=Q97AD2_THEVO|nr:glycosyltransferase [Thermoplasma volcanium]BAB60020.1 hypothetical protein [Thermoplasma volcanium GSS1]